jgi:hypothetical protein
MPLIAVIIVGALVLGGGASLAAQDSLPGSLLYPIKVNLNENIQGAFSLSNTARADWDIKVVQTRLNEAVQLASEGKLSASAQATIDNNFDSHTYDIGAIIARLKASGDDSDATAVANKFKATLTAQQALLNNSSVSASAEMHAALVPVVGEVQSALGASTVLSTPPSGAAGSSSTKRAS